MFNTPKQIFVPLTIGDEQKTVSLVDDPVYSGIYSILLDKEYQGKAQQYGVDFKVTIIQGSRIKPEHYETIAQALRNSIIRYNND